MAEVVWTGMPSKHIVSTNHVPPGQRVRALLTHGDYVMFELETINSVDDPKWSPLEFESDIPRDYMFRWVIKQLNIECKKATERRVQISKAIHTFLDSALTLVSGAQAEWIRILKEFEEAEK